MIRFAGRSFGVLTCSAAVCAWFNAAGASAHAVFDAENREQESAREDFDDGSRDADAVDAAGSDAEDAHSADEETASWTMQLSAELGIGMRDMVIPRDGLSFQVNTGVFAAVGLGFHLDHRVSTRLSIGLAARYQSSVGLVAVEKLTDGTEHARKTRAHQLEVGLVPTLRVGDSGWVVYGALGYALSEVDPEGHLVTPSYHLGGPQVRAAVQIPLGTPRLRLHLSPDGQLVVQVGDELLARGVHSTGFGAGASAALEFCVNEHWVVAASYRELRFWLGTDQGPRFTDASRFVSAQIKGRL